VARPLRGHALEAGHHRRWPAFDILRFAVATPDCPRGGPGRNLKVEVGRSRAGGRASCPSCYPVRQNSRISNTEPQNDEVRPLDFDDSGRDLLPCPSVLHGKNVSLSGAIALDNDTCDAGAIAAGAQAGTGGPRSTAAVFMCASGVCALPPQTLGRGSEARLGLRGGEERASIATGAAAYGPVRAEGIP